MVWCGCCLVGWFWFLVFCVSVFSVWVGLFFPTLNVESTKGGLLYNLPKVQDASSAERRTNSSGPFLATEKTQEKMVL